MANAGAKLSSFPEVNDIQTGDMFPLLSGGNTNAKIDYATLADAIIAKLKSEIGDGVLSINGKTGAVNLSKADVGLGNVDNTSDANKHVRANNIQWGGNNIANDISPLDVATSNLFAGNVMAYSNPAGITVEYSTDGGTTWADYGADDNSKIRFVTPETGQAHFYLGKNTTAQTATKDLLRITLDARKMGIYCNPKNILLEIRENGGSDSYVNIEYSTRSSDTSFHNFGRYVISGWSGWNSIPIYNIPSYSFGTNGHDNQTVILRLTFGFTSYQSGWESKTVFNVMRMSMLASNRWAIPSTMASVNSIYRLDENQNATFPAKVTATSFAGATATSSADGLMSKADKAKLDGIGTGSNVKSVNGKTGAVTLAKSDVGLSSVANLDQSKAIKSITRSGTTFTATALDGTTTTFTQQDSNTTYGVATSSTDGLMSKTDKAKLDGISSGADAVTIKTVKVNGTALTPDSNKAVNVTVPTLANNATTTAGGMALDARMGKTLADQASQLAKNTAQIETAGTATNAHSAGEYVMISNALYKVTASVAKGDTWTIGTNVTAASVGSEIGSLKSDLANHSALHVLPLSDIADAQNGFNISFCNVAIQGKIVLCWLSLPMNNISVPQWNDFAIAKLKSGYYPAKVNPHYPVGIINDQVTGLSASLRVVNNTIAMNTHNIVFDKSGWCWGFVAYVLT